MDNLIAIALFSVGGVVAVAGLYKTWRIVKDTKEADEVHHSLFARGHQLKPTQPDSRYQATRIGFVLSNED